MIDQILSSILEGGSQAEIVGRALDAFAREPECEGTMLLLPGTAQHNLPDYKLLEIPGMELCSPFRGDSLFVVTRGSSLHHAARPSAPYPISLHLAVDFDNQLVRYLRPILQHKLVGNNPQLAYFYFAMLEGLQKGTINSFSCHPFLIEDLVMQELAKGDEPRDKPERSFAVFQEYVSMSPDTFGRTRMSDEDIDELVDRHHESYLRERRLAHDLTRGSRLNPVHVQEVIVAYLVRAARVSITDSMSEAERFLELCRILDRRIPLLEQELVLAYHLACGTEHARGFYKKITRSLTDMRSNPASHRQQERFMHAVNNTAWDIHHIRLLSELDGLDMGNERLRGDARAPMSEVVPFHVLATLDGQLQRMFALLDYRAIIVSPNHVATPVLACGLHQLAKQLGVVDEFEGMVLDHRRKSASYVCADDVRSVLEQEVNRLRKTVQDG